MSNHLQHVVHNGPSPLPTGKEDIVSPDGSSNNIAFKVGLAIDENQAQVHVVVWCAELLGVWNVGKYVYQVGMMGLV